MHHCPTSASCCRTSLASQEMEMAKHYHPNAIFPPCGHKPRTQLASNGLRVNCPIVILMTTWQHRLTLSLSWRDPDGTQPQRLTSEVNTQPINQAKRHHTSSMSTITSGSAGLAQVICLIQGFFRDSTPIQYSTCCFFPGCGYIRTKAELTST